MLDQAGVVAAQGKGKGKTKTKKGQGKGKGHTPKGGPKGAGKHRLQADGSSTASNPFVQGATRTGDLTRHQRRKLARAKQAMQKEEEASSEARSTTSYCSEE